MSEKRTPKTQSKHRFRIIKGKKNSLKRIIALTVCACCILAVLLFQFLSPTGIYETIQNAYALSGNIGDGDFTDPESVVEQFESRGNALMLLTTSYFEIFNKSGNNVLYFKHGFSDPVMDLSESRAVVYDRGGKYYKIFNYSTVLFEGTSSGNIISADIGRNGSYCLITESQGSASELFLYSKNHSLEMNWKSEQNVLSAVALNKSCNKVAVNEIYAVGGVMSSKIDIFKTGNNSPDLSITFEDTVITSLFNCFGKLIAASSDSVYVINWRNGEYSKLDIDGIISFLDEDNSGNLMVVYSRSDKQTYNTVKTFDDDLDVVSATEINAVLEDVITYKGKTYAVFDNKLNIYDIEGNLVDTKQSENNIQRIAMLDSKNRIGACGTANVFIF